MSPRKTWEERFQELVQFKKRFGHADIPGSWPANQPLAEWARRQRTRDYASLAPTQKARLSSLGFKWSLREHSWEERFIELKAFHQKYRHCKVPWGWRKNPGLRGWVLRQRYRKQTLSPDRIRKLEQLGFKWLRSRPGRPRSKKTGRFTEK